jgi:hypothetical protein
MFIVVYAHDNIWSIFSNDYPNIRDITSNKKNLTIEEFNKINQDFLFEDHLKEQWIFERDNNNNYFKCLIIDFKNTELAYKEYINYVSLMEII